MWPWDKRYYYYIPDLNVFSAGKDVKDKLLRGEGATAEELFSHNSKGSK